MYKKLYSIFFISFFYNSAIAQFPAPYCAEVFSNAVEPITRVQFAQINNNSSDIINGTPAHENFTGISGFVARGNTYTITVKGNTGGNFTDFFRLFVDWNNDSDFIDPGESFDLGSITNSTGLDAAQTTANITIPLTAVFANLRMRVSKLYNAYPTPCNTIGWGQSEDYSLLILNAGGYCIPEFPTAIEPITRVTFAHINNNTSNTINGTPPLEEYSVYTNPGLGRGYVFPGQTYPITVKGNTGGNFTNYIRLFVDWNGNGLFTDPGESYDVGTITNSTGLDAIQVTANITVPPTTFSGNKRMRVAKLYNAYPDPCNIGGYGQTEDYNLVVYNMTPYCNQDYPTGIEPITSVSLAQLTNLSNEVIDATPPNEDFTLLSPQLPYLTPGNTYPIRVKGNTGGNFTNYIRAFFDWNNDNDFLDANESYDIGTITNSTGLDAIEAVGNITVPVGTALGFKRMRITKKYNEYSTGCDVTGYGQSEDYRVSVFSMDPYCTNDFPSIIEPITLVNFGGINNASLGATNYSSPHENYTTTNLAGIIRPNFTYPITVKGNTNGNNTNYISAFIDWNNDNDFLDAGENYNVGTITNSTGSDAIQATSSITIPANASLGYHRFRVVKSNGNYPTACLTGTVGQAEDYLIKVVTDTKAIIENGNTFLQGDFVEVGINQCGSWGTTRNAPGDYHARSGINLSNGGNNLLNLGFVADPQKNGWTVGSPNKYNGDYFLPFSPFVGWGITYNSTTSGNERTNSNNSTCASLASTSGGVFVGSNTNVQSTSTRSIGTWEGLQNGLRLVKTTTIKQDKVYFTVQIKLHNTTGSPITGIYYGEYVNPDNDAYQADTLVGTSASISTDNSIIFQNPTNSQSLVQSIGTGPANQRAYMGLGSKDCRSRVFWGNIPQGSGSISNWYNGSSTYRLTGGLLNTNSIIGISFNIGTLAAGDSTTFTYAYILKQDDYNDALNETNPTFTHNTTTTVPSGGTITPCANSTNTITLNDADGYTWTWSPATGLNTTVGRTVDMTVTTTPITYTVTGVSASGCSNKAITLNVEPVVISDVVTSPATITKCLGDPPVLLTATGGAFNNILVYNETFNGEGNDWDKVNTSTGGIVDSATWILRPSSYTYPAIPITFNSNDNSQFYLSNSHSQGAAATATSTALTTPAISTLNYTAATLSFYHFFFEPSTGLSTSAVEISTDLSSWTNLQTYNSTQGASNSFALVSISIPAGFLNQPSVYVRFRYNSTSQRYYWAVDNIKITASGQPIVWSPITDLFTDVNGTIPYTGNATLSVYANPATTAQYFATSSAGICSKTNSVDVTVTPLSNTLAGVISSAVCQSKSVVVTGSIFNNTVCEPIAKVEPSGGSPVSGTINTCVYISPTVLPTYNAEPYLPRHFDILPTTNPSTSTAKITLYVPDAEFVQYNANNGLWPDLPTVAGGGNTDPNRANLRITQYHGTPNTNPSSPNQYSASTAAYINPNDANIFWNGNYWEISFDVTGFSGFYIHTNLQYALPVTINYLNGKKQGNAHLLDWKVTCNSTPKVTMVLERNGDNRLFTQIKTTIATATECLQPFVYTDNTPLQGINYYRLKIIDADGEITYSNTIALINDFKGFDLMSIAPNPINGDGSFKLNITTAKEEKINIIITDMQGRVVEKRNLSLQSGFNAVNMNVGKLAAGSYTILGITSNGDKSKTIRFVKQ